MKEKKDKEFIAQIVIVSVLALLLAFNLGRLSVSGNFEVISGEIIKSASAFDVIPGGIPKIYGIELGVRYDDVSLSNPRKADTSISILANLDKQLILAGEDLRRYIRVASEISCEYCCGAKSIIFSNGQAACGCAHSYAMRGLAKYLIKNHGDEFSDEEILEELGKWKVLFFPEIHETKASILRDQGIELNYINLASNKYRGIERGQASGGMVGGC